VIKILVIEDETLVAKLYKEILTKAGLEVTTAIGGRDGLIKVKKEKPDLVLLDIMMPEPNGIQVLEELKKDKETRDIPVVVLTNLSGKKDAELALSKGAEAFWVKEDADPKWLRGKVKAVLNKKSKATKQ
jgi:CheY-like chemotaxis protein